MNLSEKIFIDELENGKSRLMKFLKKYMTDINITTTDIMRLSKGNIIE